MNAFDTQFHRQGGRCFWCQLPTPVQLMTRDHLHPRKRRQRERFGSAYVLACGICNHARGALTIGSRRFHKWLCRVLRGDVRRLSFKDKRRAPRLWKGNPS